jgi:DNA-binding GntR family transcriptional regulator
MPMPKTTDNKKNKHEDLTQKAYMGIRQMLFHNQIVAGQKIPFKDLAVLMEMSNTPVIQALKFLEFQGLVRREPNKGYYIQPLSLEEIEEIYRYRELLEVSLLGETARHFNDKARKRLQTAYDHYLKSLEGIYVNEKLIKDREFHITLAALSGQKIRLRSLNHIFDLLHLKYRASLQYVSVEKSDLTEHGKVFDAICDKDFKLAQTLLGAHISHVRKHAVLNLRRMIEEKSDFSF